MSGDDRPRATITDLMAKQKDKTAESRPVKLNKDRKEQAPDQSADHGPTKLILQDRLRSNDMLVPGSGLGVSFSDEYRRIKRPILSNAFGKSSSLVERGNLVLVTSSVPGEGKSYTAVNLALSIAQEKDNTVLLVDTDVARKGTSRMLGLQDKPGLVDVLVDEDMTVGDVMMRTDIPGLGIISAGKQVYDVAELLASHRMAAIVDEMASRYDDRLIIFDGPPLLPTPQTQILAGLVGQVAFIIEAGRTPQAVVEEAIDLIPEEQPIGIIMNKSEGISARGGYYYGYYGADENTD